MVDKININNMFERLGFSQESSMEITGNQGIGSVKELHHPDNAKVATLCQVVWWPGGTYAEGIGADPGVSFSAKAEENLKLVTYFIMHQC